MHRLILAAFALTVLAACQPATTELTEEQKGEIAAEVQLLHDQYWDAWRETDKDRGMSYYRNSPDFVFANGVALVKGWGTLNEAVQSWTVESQVVTIDESIATVLAPDIVHFVENGTYSVTSTSGETGPDIPFAVSTIWVLRDGEWKVDFGHISRLAPQTE